MHRSKKPASDSPGIVSRAWNSLLLARQARDPRRDIPHQRLILGIGVLPPRQKASVVGGGFLRMPFTFIDLALAQLHRREQDEFRLGPKRAVPAQSLLATPEMKQCLGPKEIRWPREGSVPRRESRPSTWCALVR